MARSVGGPLLEDSPTKHHHSTFDGVALRAEERLFAPRSYR